MRSYETKPTGNRYHGLQWNGNELLGSAKEAAFYGIVQSAYFLRTYLRNMIGVPGFGVSSDPGNPPHLQTGELQKSIKVMTSNMLDQAFVYSDSPYWMHLEYGTKNSDGSWRIRPRPFFRRAITETRLPLAKIAKSSMKHYMENRHIRTNFDPQVDPFA